VILIIGGIYSFFKRQLEKHNEQQQPSRSRQRQQQTGAQRAETMSMPKEEPIRPSRPERQRTERAKKIDNNIQEMYEAKREELKDAFQYEEEKVRRVRKPAPKPKLKARTVQNNVIPNPDNIAQGVVWAEILGPPRSRKPHHYASRFNRR
jgi:hypothetical protein